MRCSLLYFLCMVIVSSAAAQPAFVRMYGGSDTEWANGIIHCGDGGYVMVGATFSGDGDFSGMRKGQCDGWIMKCRADGSVQWKRTVGGSKYDNLLAVAATNDEGFVVCGNSYSNDGDVAGMNNGSSDILLVKIDADGIVQWTRTYGGSADEDACSIVMARDGGYVLTGGSWSSDGLFDGTPQRSSSDIFVMRINSRGTVEWVRTQGGEGNDRGEGLIVDGEGAIVVTGSSASDAGDFKGFSRGSDDVILLCYDDDGALLRKKTYGGRGSDIGRAVVNDARGGYVLTGWTTSDDGTFVSSNRRTKPDAFVMRLDTAGSITWLRTFGGSGEDRAFALLPSKDGGVMSLGGTSSSNADFAFAPKGKLDVFLVDFDSTGGVRNKNVYGGDDDEQGYAMTSTSDGGVAMAGYSSSKNGDFARSAGGSGDVFLLVTRGDAPINVADTISVSPNPLSSQCTCTFIAHTTTPLRIDVVTAGGHIVERFVDRTVTPGTYSWTYDTSALASGMYLFTAATSNAKLSAKLIVIR
jgi:hypothetical protein